MTNNAMNITLDEIKADALKLGLSPAQVKFSWQQGTMFFRLSKMEEQLNDLIAVDELVTALRKLVK